MFQEVGYPNAKHYTNPSDKVDFAFYDNTDIGWTTELAVGDTYEFALPYPADVDLDSEALILHWIDFICQRNVFLDADSSANTLMEAIDITFSMLNVDFNATDDARHLNSVNALEFKKTFDGPYFMTLDNGTWIKDLTTSGASGVVAREIQPQAELLRWIPLHPLDLPLPLFIQLINRSQNVTADTMDTIATEGVVATTVQSTFAMRIFYTKRGLTASEKSLRGQAKFQRLGA